MEAGLGLGPAERVSRRRLADRRLAGLDVGALDMLVLLLPSNAIDAPSEVRSLGIETTQPDEEIDGGEEQKVEPGAVFSDR